MNLKKTVAIAAAAGALAAISVPAMALENEFHGSYTFNTLFSNFQNGGGGDFSPATTFLAPVAPATTPTVVSTYGDNRKMNNYFEQRARLQYVAKASDDLKLVTHYEINNRFGDQPNGADLDTDGLNIIVKHAYLDFNLGKNFNVKTGLQAYKDTIKGLFIDADVPAIMTTTKLGAYTLGLGFSRFDDDGVVVSGPGTAGRIGDKNKDLFILDNTFAFSKDTKAALSYYFLADYANGGTGYPAANAPASSILETTGNGDAAILLHTFGLSGETKVGPLALSGFAAAQLGHQKAINVAPLQARRSFHGWAANVAAKMAVGPGTAKTAFLFTSGNNSTDAGHYKGWVTSSVNSYNESGLMILARNSANSPTSTDRYIRRNVSNIALATIGYDAKLSDKLYANANVGFGWAPASQQEQHADLKAAIAGNGRNNNNGDFMGTEINLETGYKVYQNLTLRAQAAYMILGSYYKDSALKNNFTSGTAASYQSADPENPYTMRLLASYAF